MSRKGGPVDRSLPARTGVAGSVATSLGKIVTASTQAGPIRYTTANGHEYCSIDYLAVKVTAPKSVKEIVKPLLADGGKCTHGSVHEDLTGWNLVVDVSDNRDKFMALPQRIDHVATCLNKEQVKLEKTVFVALYTGKDVSPKVANGVLTMIKASSRFASVVHLALVYASSPQSLTSWSKPQAAAPVARPVVAKKGGKGDVAAAKGGKGNKGAGGKGTRGNLQAILPQTGGRQAGGGKAGGKAAGKGGKKGQVIVGGLLKKVTRDGTLTFSKSTRAVPY